MSRRNRHLSDAAIDLMLRDELTDLREKMGLAKGRTMQADRDNIRAFRDIHQSDFHLDPTTYLLGALWTIVLPFLLWLAAQNVPYTLMQNERLGIREEFLWQRMLSWAFVVLCVFFLGLGSWYFPQRAFFGRR